MKSLQIVGLLLMYICIGMSIKSTWFPSETTEVDFQWYFGSLIPGTIGIVFLVISRYIKKQKQKTLFKKSW